MKTFLIYLYFCFAFILIVNDSESFAPNIIGFCMLLIPYLFSDKPHKLK